MSYAGNVFSSANPAYSLDSTGRADSSASFQALLNDAARGAFTKGGNTLGLGVVELSGGTFKLDSTVNIPNHVLVKGSGVRTTLFKWGGDTGSSTTAVFISNQTRLDSGGFLMGTTLRDFSLDCSKESVGMALHGWNENAEMENVRIFSSTSECLHLDAVAQPAINRTQHASFKRLKFGPVQGSTALFCRDVQRCHFDQFTVDTADTAQPIANGIILTDNSNENVFTNVHLENCTLPVDIDSSSKPCSGNVFIALNVASPEVTPEATVVGSENTTIAFLARAGTKKYLILGMRDDTGYANLIYDEQQGRTIKGRGTDNGITSTMFVMASENTDSSYTRVFLSDNIVDIPAQTGGRKLISASTDNINLKDISVLQVNTSKGDVVLGGATGGQAGQVVHVIKTTAANDLVIEHAQNEGEQNFNLPSSADIVVDTYGGATLVSNGAGWFVPHSSK